MTVYTLDGTRPPIVTRGLAQTRRLAIFTDAATTETTGIGGAYDLLDSAGATVSGATNITVTNSTTAPFTPSASITPGSAYAERWTVTVGGTSRVYIVPCVVQTWTLADDELLIAPVHIIAGRYAGMTEYPAGVTSWLGACTTATAEVLSDLHRMVSRAGVQITDRSALSLLALDKACETIFDMMARHGNTGAETMSRKHAAAYIDRWAGMVVKIDTNADGVADKTTQARDRVSFPGPGPVG